MRRETAAKLGELAKTNKSINDLLESVGNSALVAAHDEIGFALIVMATENNTLFSINNGLIKETKMVTFERDYEREQNILLAKENIANEEAYKNNFAVFAVERDKLVEALESISVGKDKGRWARIGEDGCIRIAVAALESIMALPIEESEK
jgi:hypothetical protein